MFIRSFYIILASLLTLSAFATELGVRPIYDFKRSVFFLGEKVPSEKIALEDSPFEIHLLEDASRRCNLSPDALKEILGELVRHESSLYQNLNPIFNQSFEKLNSKKIILIVDDFTSFLGPKPKFSSYFFSQGDQKIIGLDCSSYIRRSYWLASLVHESVHALSQGEHTESWWEEGLAQILEEQIGGTQPQLTVKTLERSMTIPMLTEMRRPFLLRENYALSYLFLKYLSSQWGGMSLLKAMTLEGEDAKRGCLGKETYFGKILCRGENFLNSENNTITNLKVDQFTEKGVLRFFYVALAMNNASYSKYQIPGWNGFRVEPYRSMSLAPVDLDPGQMLRFNSKAALGAIAKINAQLEVYRLLVGENGRFLILRRDEMTEVPVGVKILKDEVLLLNLSGMRVKVVL